MVEVSSGVWFNSEWFSDLDSVFFCDSCDLDNIVGSFVSLEHHLLALADKSDSLFIGHVCSPLSLDEHLEVIETHSSQNVVLFELHAVEVADSEINFSSLWVDSSDNSRDQEWIVLASSLVLDS